MASTFAEADRHGCHKHGADMPVRKMFGVRGYLPIARIFSLA